MQHNLQYETQPYQLPVTSYQLLTNASILLFFGLFFCCTGFLGLGVFLLLALSLVFITFHKLLNRFQSHFLHEVRHPRTLTRHVLQEVRHPRVLVRHTIEWLKPMFLVLFDIKLVTESQNSHLREANTV